MKKRSYKIFSMSVFLVLISCARQYYVQPTGKDVATVSFSNLSDEVPQIYIVSGGKSLPVSNYLIENKKPQDKSKYKTKIVAGEIITIKYEYNFILSEKTQITTTYSKFQVPKRVNNSSYKNASTCSSEVSFSPVKNRHYEVYFGIDKDKCIIKASEAIEAGVSKKQLYSIPNQS